MKYIPQLIIIILLSGAFSVRAQDRIFGLKGGLNISHFEGDNEGQESKNGFHIAVIASLPLSDRFKYQPEIAYSKEGNGFEGIDNAINDFGYLNLTPLLFKFYPTKSGLNIHAGLQIGVLLFAKNITDDEEINIKSLFQNENPSAVFGLGFDDSCFFISTRFNFGLYSITDNPIYGELTSRVVQLSIGLKF